MASLSRGILTLLTTLMVLFTTSQASFRASTVCFQSLRTSYRFRPDVSFVSTAATRTRRLSTTSNLLSSSPIGEGDKVRVAWNGKTLDGTVEQVRGSGWYAVKVTSSMGDKDGSSSSLVKVRASKLSRIAPSIVTNDTTTASANESIITTVVIDPEPQTASVVVPPPTIVDIDAALQASNSGDAILNKRDRQYLEQCAHHATFEKWVMFTDLHCAPSSLDTCVQILTRVHEEAVQRKAGVLFLGDFWHHRATIRIDVLNAVLDAFRDWRVPLIMIPGNHDQITLGGLNHGLTPLEHAFRLEYDNDKSVPGPLVLTHPTKFREALFVPHIRNVTTMESVVTSNHALNSSALFVHADVTGAYMNDLIVSHGGVKPSMFPCSIPIYSGHFHKPHLVTSGKVSIEYIGSPYQTSLSEAGQLKSLLVLDASQGWKCIERIPVHIGRRHFRVTSIDEVLALNVNEAMSNDTVRAGDRVVVTLPEQELEHTRRSAAASGNESAVDAHIQTLKKAGAFVELREIAPHAIGPLMQADASSSLEGMTPPTTLVAFLREQVRRESLTNATAEELLKAGLLLLDDVELSSEEANDSFHPNMTDLTLESVTLQGFGPFQSQVTYPLCNRGLVLVRGTNKDGGADSNGSGKSTLAMATLWALTGTLDPRPMMDAKVADVVNDECKSARVCVRGTLNGEPFVLSRTKTSTKGTLAFHLKGEDLTAQSIKETQAIVDEKLGVGSDIVARTMFHGQHSINGLLEATDVSLKEELSLVVPLSMWQQGASLARAKSREASKKASEVGGMIQLRTNDLDDLKKRRDEAEVEASKKRESWEHLDRQVTEKIRELRKESFDVGAAVSIYDIQIALDAASTTVRELEAQLSQVLVERDKDVAKLVMEKDEALDRVESKRNELDFALREQDRAFLALNSARANTKVLEKKWNVNMSNVEVIDFVSPQVCPTCQQPISNSGVGHSHEAMQRIVTHEVEEAMSRFSAAELALQQATDVGDAVAQEFDQVQEQFKQVMGELEKDRSTWADKVKSIEQELSSVRNLQAALSLQVSKAAMELQHDSIIRAQEATLREEQKAVESVTSTYKNLCKSVKDAEAALEELHESGESHKRLSSTMTSLADVFGPRGIQTFVLQTAIDALESISQAYLEELSNGSQRLELALDAGDKISRKAFICGPDGTFIERPLSLLSGGQWRRCSFALSLGFADLVARRGRLKTSLCVLDEPLTHLDRAGRASVGHLLRKLLGRNDNAMTSSHGVGMSVSTILLILQDLAAEELEESFDRIDEVVKVNGRSSVAIDEQS